MYIYSLKYIDHSQVFKPAVGIMSIIYNASEVTTTSFAIWNIDAFFEYYNTEILLSISLSV